MIEDRRQLRDRFEAVAMPHLDFMYRAAHTLCRNGPEAEDLVQETYTRAFRGFAGFELRDYGAKPWLLKILHNAFYTLKARQRREPTLLDDVAFDQFEDELADAELEPATATTINWDKVDEELKAAVTQLAPEYQTTLLLWAVEGLSYKEIAIACNCAMGTVMSRLYRARQLLGRQLRDYARQRKISTKRFKS